MSTRACYTFKDQHNTFHVYKHSDGYPTGAAQWIAAAVPFAWELPRFEASDFGAAFIAGNKKRGGSCYLMHTGEIKAVAPGDINYRYEIECEGGIIQVTAYKTKYWEDRVEEQLWRGPLSEMMGWAEQAAA